MISGPAHDGQRRVRVDDAAFGNGVQVQPAKVAVRGEIGEKIVGEELLAGAVAMAAQVVDVGGAEMGVLHPVDQPGQPGVDAVAGAVLVIVRVAPEVVVELHFLLVHAPGR
jgi:hypothetical protein